MEASPNDIREQILDAATFTEQEWGSYKRSVLELTRFNAECIDEKVAQISELLNEIVAIVGSQTRSAMVNNKLAYERLAQARTFLGSLMEGATNQHAISALEHLGTAQAQGQEVENSIDLTTQGIFHEIDAKGVALLSFLGVLGRRTLYLPFLDDDQLRTISTTAPGQVPPGATLPLYAGVQAPLDTAMAELRQYAQEI